MSADTRSSSPPPDDRQDLDPTPGASLEEAPAEDRESDYVTRVSNAFLSLRGTGLFLSSRDMETILEWWEAGVPLGTVLRGMARGAERLHAAGRPIRSLARLKRHVKAAQRGQGLRFRPSEHAYEDGVAAGNRSPADTCDKIVALIDQQVALLQTLTDDAGETRPGLIEPARAARKELDAIRATPRSLEWAAGAILEAGRKFYLEVLGALDEEERNTLEEQAEATLRGLSDSMSDQARKATLEEIMVGLLRERYGLFRPGDVLALWDA